MSDYHNFTTKDMPVEQRRKLNVGDIWINSIKCKKCGDVIRSKNVHDYVECKCGEVAVDGGSWYHKVAAKDLNNVESMCEPFTFCEEKIIMDPICKKELRENIGKILVKWSMPTRQVAILEIVNLMEQSVSDEVKVRLAKWKKVAGKTNAMENEIDHSIDIRYEIDPIAAFDKFIKKWCGEWVSHLTDNDENDGEFMREKIRTLQENSKQINHKGE